MMTLTEMLNNLKLYNLYLFYISRPGLVVTGSSAPSLTVTVRDSVCSSSWPDGVLSLRMMSSCKVRSPWGRVGAIM